MTGEKMAGYLDTLLRNAAAKLLLGMSALISAWLIVSAMWPSAFDPDSYLRPSLRHLLAATHPVGALAACLIAALIIGDIGTWITKAALRRYSTLMIAKGSVEWEIDDRSLSRGYYPFSRQASLRFMRHVEEQDGYGDVLPEHRDATKRAALEAAPRMLSAMNSTKEVEARYQLEESEGIFRIALAASVPPLAGLVLANVESPPLFLLAAVVVAVVVATFILAWSGWQSWRDSQSLALQAACDGSTDLSDIVRSFAAKAS